MDICVVWLIDVLASGAFNSGAYLHPPTHICIQFSFALCSIFISHKSLNIQLIIICLCVRIGVSTVRSGLSLTQSIWFILIIWSV